MEVWAETDQPLENPTRSWLTALIVAVGQQVAFEAITPEHLGRFGMGSFEIPISQMKFDGTWPSSVVSADGTVGMIIGATSPTRPDRLAAPFDDVRYFNIRVISAAELRELVAGGLPVGNAPPTPDAKKATRCVTFLDRTTSSRGATSRGSAPGRRSRCPCRRCRRPP